MVEVLVVSLVVVVPVAVESKKLIGAYSTLSSTASWMLLEAASAQSVRMMV